MINYFKLQCALNKKTHGRLHKCLNKLKSRAQGKTLKTCLLELQLSSAVRLFPKDCIYISKLYCTENIQNVHNHTYNIPQSWPGNTKQVYLALEKLLTPAYQCNIVFSF